MTKWKLVPVEPDANQIYAMRAAFSKVRRGGAGGQTMDACYQRENAPELSAYSAMLEAAPQPPKLSDELILEIAESSDVSLVERDKLTGRLLVYNSIGAVYELVRAVEREILGETK